MTLPAKKILKIIDAAGLLRVQLAADLWLVLVPVKANTVTILNPDSMQPHELKAEITAARPVLLSFGSTGASIAKSHAAWDAVGAIVVVPKTMEGVVKALESVGFDLEKALEVAK